jgi:hypothetical protein
MSITPAVRERETAQEILGADAKHAKCLPELPAGPNRHWLCKGYDSKEPPRRSLTV